MAWERSGADYFAARFGAGFFAVAGLALACVRGFGFAEVRDFAGALDFDALTWAAGSVAAAGVEGETVAAGAAGAAGLTSFVGCWGGTPGCSFCMRTRCCHWKRWASFRSRIVGRYFCPMRPRAPIPGGGATRFVGGRVCRWPSRGVGGLIARMPSFDITCEVDLTEVKNATNMVRKELQTRFDFRGVQWEMIEDNHLITLSAESEFKLEAVLEVLQDRLSRRGVSQKNVEIGKMETSSTGRARQVLTLRDSIPADIAKEIAVSLRQSGLKVQAAIEHGKVRVTGKKRDDLQEVIALLRKSEFELLLQYDNFRD